MQQSSKLGGRAAWITLAVVSLTQAASLLDRQVLTILLPRIKADLQVGDAEMGLLYGTVFALFYALFSLPLGRLADGWVRTRLLGFAILGWSGMTALAGFATTFPMLALSRLGVGIGEAAVQPAGFSLLSDRFPRHMKGTFNGVMAAGLALGISGALWLGGAVPGWWDGLYPAGTAPLGIKGWQAAFIAAAIPGPILALALFSLREPVRGAADGIAPPHDPHPARAAWATLAAILPGTAWLNFARRNASGGVWAVNVIGLVLIVALAWSLSAAAYAVRPVNPIALAIGPVRFDGNALQWIVTGFGMYVLLCWAQSLWLADRPAFRLIFQSPAMVLTLAVASLQIIINYGVQGWVITYALRTYNADPASTGLHFGLLSGVVGIAGPLIAGPLGDALGKRIPAGRIYVSLAALTISPFLAFFVFRAPSLESFYLWFIPYGLILTMWMPPIYSAVLDLVLPRLRGIAMSFYLLVTTIFGMGIGPYTVGLISDSNGGHLGPAILGIYWVAPIIVILLILLIRRLPKDEALLLERARAAGEPV